MAELVYILCAATSIACAVLLYRGYRRGRKRLLYWSSLCFAFLALNNIVLVLDFIVLPVENFEMVRSVIALMAVTILLVGMVWEAR